nr:MAG TPA: hypothetical protein [Bacteriophage sp.]DAX38337.1 MAG TPA: hypothetical protein [Caudoviricetes sp.]DAZ57192.1 MAG TPA: hypothetical protein [Caudoviricetes sp.]
MDYTNILQSGEPPYHKAIIKLLYVLKKIHYQ